MAVTLRSQGCLLIGKQGGFHLPNQARPAQLIVCRDGFKHDSHSARICPAKVKLTLKSITAMLLLHFTPADGEAQLPLGSVKWLASLSGSRQVFSYRPCFFTHLSTPHRSHQGSKLCMALSKHPQSYEEYGYWYPACPFRRVTFFQTNMNMHAKPLEIILTEEPTLGFPPWTRSPTITLMSKIPGPLGVIL